MFWNCIRKRLWIVKNKSQKTEVCEKNNKVIKPKEIEKNTTIEPQIAPQRVIKENVKNENAMKKNKKKNKYIAALLAFFFGIFGGHKFYTGHWIAGIIHALISLTGISALLSFVEAIIYLVISNEKFDSKIVKRKEK